MMTSPGEQDVASAVIVDSVGSPAGTITQTARGADERRDERLRALAAPRAPAAVRACGGRGIAVVRDDGVAAGHEPRDHVQAHLPETDEPELHACSRSVLSLATDRRSSRRRGSAVRAASIQQHLRRARAGAPAPAGGRAARAGRSCRAMRSRRVACASSSVPNENGLPGIGRSSRGVAVINRNTPVFGPPLCSCPVECR